jgi:ATP-dependent RNA helicase DDX55/SPB4
MPEVREWRKKGGGGDWQDAEVDVSPRRKEEIIYQGKPSLISQWDSFGYADKARETHRVATLEEKRLRPAVLPDTDNVADAKRKVRAEMREAWSEQKEKRAKKEERKDKREKRKQAQWDAREEQVGMVEAFKREKGIDRDGGPGANGSVDKGKKSKEGEKEERDEYRALKKELKEETGRGREEKGQGGIGGMFGDLD